MQSSVESPLGPAKAAVLYCVQRSHCGHCLANRGGLEERIAANRLWVAASANPWSIDVQVVDDDNPRDPVREVEIQAAAVRQLRAFELTDLLLGR